MNYKNHTDAVTAMLSLVKRADILLAHGKINYLYFSTDSIYDYTFTLQVNFETDEVCHNLKINHTTDEYTSCLEYLNEQLAFLYTDIEKEHEEKMKELVTITTLVEETYERV